MRLLRLPTQSADEIDLDLMLTHLAGLGIDSLMIEGGAKVITAFLHQRLVNQVLITIVPLFIGGLHAIEHLLGQDGNRMELTPVSSLSFPKLSDIGFGQWGEDWVVWGRLVRT